MSRRPKKNDRVYIGGIPEYFQVEMKVKSTLLESVFVRPKGGREDIEVSESDLFYLDLEELESGEKIELIKKLVKEEFLTDIILLRREQGVLNRLLKKYPDVDFWRGLEIGFQMRSLLFWIGKNGSPQIEQMYREFTLDKNTAKGNNKSVTNITTEKVGEDIVVRAKPRNLLDII